MVRRRLLRSALALPFAARMARAGYEVDLSEAALRARLSPAGSATLRQTATERAFGNGLKRERSDLPTEARTRTDHCAGRENPVGASKAGFDSGTGWASFWDALPRGIGTLPGSC
jgi:peptide-methionine (R)-S-oxide reductase